MDRSSYTPKVKISPKKIVVITLATMVLFSIVLAPAAANSGQDNIKIVEVYVFSDPGSEYVALENWGSDTSLKGWKLTNGRAAVYLPDIVLGAGERLVLAEDEDGYRDIWQEPPCYTWDESGLVREGYFRLRDTGDDVFLMNGDRIVDVFSYGDGEEVTDGWDGSRYRTMGRGEYAKRGSRDTNTAEDWIWARTWRVGQSNFSVEHIAFEEATLFVSPDTSSSAMMQFLESVERNLVISVYLLSEPAITDKISNLSKNDVDVRILVDGSPVGGMPDYVRRSLDIISDVGAEVMVLKDGKYSPHSYFHCKYMIADNSSVLVSSENFVNTGYPGDGINGNRGWGIILHSSEVADHFSDVYRWDRNYAHEFTADDVSYTVRSQDEILPYRSRYEHTKVEGDFTVTPVLSPDSSMSDKTILGMINDAEESIMVQQFYIHEWGYRENPYLEALIQAAERGIEVKIMLDSTWYNLGGEKNDNDYTVDRLNNISSQKNIPLEARLLDPGHGMKKIHNKGMIVDRDTVLISSINWNSNSVLQNREVGVIVQGVGGYYAEVFMNDWRFDVIRPIADAGRNREAAVGEVVRFDGRYSWDDKEIVSYRWDLSGNGMYESEGDIVSTVFREPGEYKIELIVEDGAGNVGMDRTMITVKEQQDSFMSLQEEGFPMMMLVIVSIVIFVSVLIYRRYRS